MHNQFITPPQHMHDQFMIHEQHDANLVSFSPFLLYQRQNSRIIKHMCKYNKDNMYEGKDAKP